MTKSMILGAAATLLALAASPAQADWAHIDLPKRVMLRAVAVTAPDQFHVSGSKGTYAVTHDGGRSWRLAEAPGGATHDFRGLAAFGGETALLMSAGDGPAGQARVYRSADAGRSWTLAYETRLPGSYLSTIAFRDRKSGFVLGDPIDGRWFLLRTDDGGRSWTQVEGPPAESGEVPRAASNSVLFLGPRRDVWIASGGLARGRVFRSRDDGRTWTVAETPIAGGPSGGLFGGMAVGSGAVVVGGDYKDLLRAAPSLAVTADGEVFTAPDVGRPRLLEAVGRLDARRLLAVGPRGTSLSEDNGQSWRQVDEEAFNAIACRKRVCVAAGPGGHVGVWRDEASRQADAPSR